MPEKGTLTLSKWGNSLSIRIPKTLLGRLGVSNEDKLEYEVVDNDKIMLKKADNKSKLAERFKGFDLEKYYSQQTGNQELDWGKPAGREL